ncbi:MAG: hypothetical protein LBT92_01690 [Rickettsiales bacterium]|nr:hypothetical protein [Rickettsiales bacterium]
MTIVELDSVGIAYPGWVDINEQAAYVAAYTGNVETETNDSYSCSPPVSPSIPKCPLEQVVAYLESVENNTYYMRYYSSPGQECRIPEGMQGFPLRESNGRYYISYGICTRDVSDDLHQKWSEHVYKNEKEAHVPEWMTKDRFVPIFVGNNFIPCADKAEIIKTLGL